MRPGALRAPYLKAAILFAVLLALYGGFRFTTWETERQRERERDATPPRGFFCNMTIQSKTEFTITCVPDCSTRPAPPDTSTLLGMIAADQMTPAIWHKACDGKAP